MIFFVATQFILLFICTVCNLLFKNRIILKVIDYLYRKLCWNGLLRLLLEGYVDFLIGCPRDIGHLRWDTWVDVINVFFVLTLVPLLFLSSIFFPMFFEKNRKRLKEKSFQQAWGALCDRLKVDLELN